MTSLETNLIINPGAEDSPGAIDLGTFAAPVGWTTTLNFTALAYTANYEGFDLINPADSVAIGGGKNHFTGGNTNNSTATQTINFADLAGSIDSSSLQAELSGFLGGSLGQADNMTVTATFYNAAHTSLGTLSIGPVTPADLGNDSKLIFRNTAGTIPVGTRSADIVLTARQYDGFYNNGAADNLDFRIDSKTDSAPDLSGNALADAQDLGVLNGSRSLNDFIGGVDAIDFFRFEIKRDSRFSLSLSKLSQDASVDILDSRGVLVKSVIGRSGQDGSINLDQLDAGKYYLRVYRFASQSTPYHLDVTGTPLPKPLKLYSVTPDRGNNSGQSTITISGNQFSSAAKVSLSKKGVERVATKIVQLDDEKLSATFDLTGLPVDLYDVKVSDTGGAATVTDAFGVRIGKIGQVEIYLSTPSRVRVSGTSVATITYRNVGDTDTTVPLFALEANGAMLRVPSDGTGSFTDSQVQFLGINSKGLAGVLPAGGTSSTSVHFKATADVGSKINFSLKGAAPDEAIDWASLKDKVRPSYITPEAWNAIYSNFTASVGKTVGQYQATLAENASYLSQFGQYVNDASQLLAFELQQASDYQSLSQRFSLGAFGRGKSFIGDVRAVADSQGNVTIAGSGSQRFFQKQANGSYQGQTGDYAALTLQGFIYQLREKDGTTTAFRADGQLDFIADPNGNRLTAGYTGNQLTSLNSSNGDRLILTYNAQGHVASATDQVGRTTTYSYDSTGELLLSSTDITGTTQYTYSGNQLIAVTDPNGTQIQLNYDAQGRLIGENLNNGVEPLNYTYDSVGGSTIKNANDATVKQFLNDRGQVVRLQDSLGRTQQFKYDDAGNLKQLIQPNDSVNSLSYDSRGNLVSQIDPLGQRTQFTYEPTFNRLISMTDARGNTLGYNYDGKGNPLSITYADASSERFSYDSNGNVIESVNRRNQATSYTYNSRSQLLRQSNPDGSSTDYTYDARGNLTVVTNSQGTIAMTYDNADRLTQITYPQGRVLQYTYDAGGRRTRMVDQTGKVVNYNYDSAGRLAGLTGQNGDRIVAYTYDAVGQLAREENGNGTYTTYAYDAAGQTTSIVNYTVNNAINSRFDYTYDALGRRTGMNTLDGQWTYAYDATGQLIGAVLNSTNFNIASQSLTYVYDATGNRIRTVSNGVTTDYTTNNLNQYTNAGAVTYQYDADGNLISKKDGTNTWTYAYDTQNRLVKVVEPNANQTTYEYDALGNRVATVYNGQRTEYVTDPFGLGNVVGEYNAAGNPIASYTYGLGLVQRTSTSDGAAYYDSDAIGSTVGLSGGTGSYVDRYSYSPFGEQLSKTESVANPFEYVGQWGVINESNGLNFMRARFYDNKDGRFVTRDPIGLAGDINFYRYAKNASTTFTDPTGLLPFDGSYPSYNPDYYEEKSSWVNDFEHHDGYHKKNLHTGSPSFASYRERTGLLSWLPGGFNALGGPYGQITFFKDGTYELSTDLFATYGPGPWGYGPWTYYHILGDWLPIQIDPSLDKRVYGEWKDLNKQLYEKIQKSTLDSTFSDVVASLDPNDIIGPAGFGNKNWIATPQVLPYTIYFENEAKKATAPAVQVTVTQQLNPEIDVDTFELGDFGFGQVIITVPSGFQNYSQRLDLRDKIGAFVDVEANLNRSTRTITWTLKAIDPATGQLATGADDGFLPPNNANGDGEGFIRYTVAPKLGLKTGAQIKAQASIVFDTNPAIQTPVALNAIDVGAPTSTAKMTPKIKLKGLGQEVTMRLSGTDDGSGIAVYDAYVSVDNQPLKQWLNDATTQSATYTAKAGHTYRFASAARDNVGHLEAIPTKPGSDVLQIGTNRKNKLTDGVGDDELLGLGGNDKLVCKNGNDILIGGSGSDTLSGGAGKDIFGFDLGRSFQRSIGVDNILDFDRTDKIVLATTTFTSLKRGKVKFASVQSVAEAQKSRALITYDRATGALYYNQNGAANGFGKGGQFADLANKFNLEPSNFTVQTTTV